MAAIKIFTAEKNDCDVRISRFVESVTKNMPASLMYKSFRNKRVKVNGKAVSPDYRIALGDEIRLYINDEFFPIENSTEKSAPVENITQKPDIVYEDENILVVNKPCSLLCHSDNTGDVSLIDIIHAYLAEKNEYDKSAQSRFAPALCNRIDRGTSGLVIAAKNYVSLRDMNEIIKNGYLQKQYLCITKKAPRPGVYTAYLKRDLNSKKVTVSKRLSDGFKPIKTGVTVLESCDEAALCKITLFTGRTHQIRAHLAFLQHPLLGDTKYGNREFNAKYARSNQALCAYKITFSDIPNENTLSYLSGKKIVLDNPQPKELYEKLFKRSLL